MYIGKHSSSKKTLAFISYNFNMWSIKPKFYIISSVSANIQAAFLQVRNYQKECYYVFKMTLNLQELPFTKQSWLQDRKDRPSGPSPYCPAIPIKVLPAYFLCTFPTYSTATNFCALTSKSQHVRKVGAFPLHQMIPQSTNLGLWETDALCYKGGCIWNSWFSLKCRLIKGYSLYFFPF